LAVPKLRDVAAEVALSVMLLTGGPPLVEAVAAIRKALGEGPFVFNLGHGVLPQTPPEHVAKLVALVKKSYGDK